MKSMLRSRFLWKLYAGYSTLILVSSAVVGILVSQRVERDALQEIRESLEARAGLLRGPAAVYLTDPPDSSFQTHIRTLGREIHTRLTVIKSDGTVIADSDEKPSSMDNHATRPEILAARSHGIGTARRLSHTLGTQMMYLAMPVQGPEKLVGFVRTSLPLSAIGSRLNHLRVVVALGAGLSALVALLLGLFLARNFVGPLASMTSVAESMSRGDYDKRLPATRLDEIGELARAFNRMAESSRRRTDIISADRNKLSAILSGMVEGVVAVDRDERVMHLNRAAGDLLRVSPENCLDQPLWQVTPVRQVAEILGAALRDKADQHRELKLATLSKEQVLRMHASPLHDGQGGVAGAVVVLQDVSDLHRLEVIRREFVANASHELKTPITAIRGLVETLIDDAELAASERERFLMKIKDQSMRLSSLVSDLLALSRLESEGRDGARPPLDLRHVLLTAVESFASLGGERGVALESRVPDSPLEVMGDEESLGQAVNNLLENAIKYTPRGGRVRARLKHQGNEAVIEVEDTGIGIEPAEQGRIFERFYRVDKARSRELGGTGLGLSIVKHIAIVHGGRVTLESTPGAGSTFRVFLPLASHEP